jgi:hypothetical protein
VNENLPQHIARYIEMVGGRGNRVVQLADCLDARLFKAQRINLFGDSGKRLWESLRHSAQHLSGEIQAG